MGTPSRLELVEAVVVLGGGLHADGALSYPSLRRALHGITLHRTGFAPLLVLLGKARDEGPAEAVVRTELAREPGISPEAIIPETEARTTREEAVRVSARLQLRGIRRILLVTDSLHMTRAQQLFERAGFEVLTAPADDFSNAADSPEGRLQLVRRILHELLASLYDRIAGYM